MPKIYSITTGQFMSPSVITKEDVGGLYYLLTKSYRQGLNCFGRKYS